jgi:hypothetical protein
MKMPDFASNLHHCHVCPKARLNGTQLSCAASKTPCIKLCEADTCPLDFFGVPFEEFRALRRSAVPYADWPLWAKAVKSWSLPSDRGIGDTVHRLLGTPGIIAQATFKSLGIPCECDARRAGWNASYPLKG